jgi:hypothetical protein
MNILHRALNPFPRLEGYKQALRLEEGVETAMNQMNYLQRRRRERAFS